METCLHHIDQFERKYNKAFGKDPLFGEDLLDIIQMRCQVFLHSCNTNSIEYVELGELTEFGQLQKKIERGGWVTTTLVWVDRSTPKE